MAAWGRFRHADPRRKNRRIYRNHWIILPEVLIKRSSENLKRWFFRRPFYKFGIVNPHRKYLFCHFCLCGDGLRRKAGGSGLRQSLSASEKAEGWIPACARTTAIWAASINCYLPFKTATLANQRSSENCNMRFSDDLLCCPVQSKAEPDSGWV